MNFGDTRLPERFWSKVAPCPMSGCWLWLASCRKGYGQYTIRRTVNRGAHRVAYVALRGDVTPPLELDHLCRVRSCVNPAHMEVVSSRVNTLRGEGITARQARQAECLNGHPLSGANLISVRLKKGWRDCKQCARQRTRDYRRTKGA